MRKAAVAATLLAVPAVVLVIGLSTAPSQTTGPVMPEAQSCAILVTGNTMSFLETCG